MASPRKLLERNPWVGWVIAASMFVVAGYMWYSRSGSRGDPYDPERMKEMVTVKYLDTGEEEQIPRGRIEKMLREQPVPLDPEKGLINPKTGQPTGFIFDKVDWDSTINRINREAERKNADRPPESNTKK